MAAFGDWVHGARPRTLPAAVAPVIAGTGAAVAAGSSSIPRALLAAGVALALQVGVNYANDYSDGVRGTDAERVGPMRLTASGAASPSQVKRAAFASFGVAGLLGLALCAVAGTWWLLGMGALAILAAWGYTGGRNPYGYRGLGEVFVFVFFGLVAVLGTTYTQAHQVTWPAVVAAVCIGSLACALLMVNNIRDIPTDTVSGKRTLAVGLGPRRARLGYAGMVVIPALLPLTLGARHPAVAVTVVMAVPAWFLARRVWRATEAPALIDALRTTGMLQLAYAVVMAGALVLPTVL